MLLVRYFLSDQHSIPVAHATHRASQCKHTYRLACCFQADAYFDGIFRI